MRDVAAPSSKNATGDSNPGSGDGWRPRHAANKGIIAGLGFSGRMTPPEWGQLTRARPSLGVY